MMRVILGASFVGMETQGVLYSHNHSVLGRVGKGRMFPSFLMG